VSTEVARQHGVHLPDVYANDAYPLRMSAKGKTQEPPDWWLDKLLARIASDKVTRTAMARMLIDAENVVGADPDKALTAARVKILRFLDGEKDRPPIRTVEVARVLGAALGLMPFEFTADTEEQARAMAMAKHDPASLQRVLAAGSLMVSLESGEHRLDDFLGRQSDEASSDDDPVRRRSRAGEPGQKHPRRERR
jgi:hypothetical protein